MKKIGLVAVLFFMIIGVYAQKYPQLAIGDVAPLTNLKMKDISGRMLSLDDVKQKNGLVVIFSSNRCPFVMAWEDRYVSLAKIADQHNIGFLLINSNYAQKDGAESYDKMIKHAKDAEYGDLFYVQDVDSKLANAIGAKTTPHVFFFGKDLKLVYKGAIDDNMKNKDKVAESYLKDAIEQAGHGYTVDVSETPSKGCGIKRAK